MAAIATAGTGLEPRRLTQSVERTDTAQIARSRRSLTSRWAGWGFRPMSEPIRIGASVRRLKQRTGRQPSERAQL